jgi:hypothetical protein
VAINIGFVHNMALDSEQIRQFYRENWIRKIALTDKAFYDWQFIMAPNSHNQDCCVVAYDSTRKSVVGAMGLNPRNFFIKGQTYLGAELTTWVVADRCQGSGVGIQILHFLQSQFDVLIGMGISDKALTIYRQNGLGYLSAIPRFVKVINFDNIKVASVYTSLAPKLMAQWAAKPVENYLVTDVSDAVYQRLFTLHKVSHNLFSRENDHRAWRYTHHPVFKYQQFLVSPATQLNDETAYVALREEHSVARFNVLHVMDLFGDEQALNAAVHFIEQYARDKGFDVIDFYCTASSIYRFMLCNGWFSINDDACFQFPHLFHPVEMRTPPTTSLIYWAKHQFAAMADLSRLYITKQDADMDRPTFYTLSQNQYLMQH